MTDLREEIRAILREEIAALRVQDAPLPPSVEPVRMTNSADLNRFARDLVMRATDPDFAQAVASGRISFALAGGGAQPHATAPAPGPTAGAPLEKSLVTERDIAALAGTTRVLRLARETRLTPLAHDEARRRGIRIERNER
jgi:hypothetical protein